MRRTRVFVSKQVLALSCLVLFIARSPAHGDGSIAFNGASMSGTSKIENTTANLLQSSNDVTICAWVYPTGQGENGAGMVAALNATGSAFKLHRDVSSTLAFIAEWTTTDGKWTIPVPSNTWSAVYITYNKTATGNNPSARVNFVAVTPAQVGLDPGGTPVSAGTGYCVGNLQGNGNTWEGRIAHVQIFDRPLTTAEADACLRAPGSIRSGLRLWLPMTNANDIKDLSSFEHDGIATDLITDISGPMITNQPGVLPGVTILNAGWYALREHIIPRFANGVTHPAGKLQGQGPMSVVQGILYGAVDGTNPQEIVVTEDYGAMNMSQWTKGIGGYAEAILQPVVRDLSIFGKVDVAGYEDTSGPTTDIVHSDNMQKHNRLFPYGKGIDFNGSSSKLLNAGADVLANQKTVTVCCWIDPDSRGESDVGFVLVLDPQELPGTASFVIRHDASDDKLTIVKNPGAGGTNGIWTIPIIDEAWNAVCVRLDFSGDYAPTARVNLRKVTPTQVTAPVGINDQPAAGYCVGNRTFPDRTWDGRIAHVQVFNRILSDGEADGALIDPGSVTAGLRLHLPMDGASNTQDETANDFDGTGTELTDGVNFHNREAGLAMRASGPLVADVGFFHIAGTACIISRDSNAKQGSVQPFDREFATLRDLSVYRAYSGVLINSNDTEVGNIEAEFLRDWGVKVAPGAVAKFEGAVHTSGIFSGTTPGSYGTGVWFEDDAGPCWGSGPWYCETSNVGMRMGNSGTRIENFYSHSCTHRNLWLDWTGERNTVVNFEIDVLDGITENNGGEAVLIWGQSSMLSKGTIGAEAAVPNGEIAIRIRNGTRQTIRDVDILGTAGSTAPLIILDGVSDFANPNVLKDSVIVAKCHGAGTFLELHPVYTTGTGRGSTNTSIQLAAATGLVDDELNGMTVFITSGTGADQARTITDYVAATGIATVSSAWTINPPNGSTYEVRINRLGRSNYIRLTTDDTVTKKINLPPAWDDRNRISVDGLKLRGGITDVSAAAQAVITSPSHGLSNNDKIAIQGVEGETAVNSGIGQVHVITYLTDNTFSIPVSPTGGSSYKPGTGYWGDWEAK